MDACTQTPPLPIRRPLCQRRRSLSPNSAPHLPSPTTRDRIAQLRKDAYIDLSKTSQDYDNRLVARMRYLESLPADEQRVLLGRLMEDVGGCPDNGWAPAAAPCSAAGAANDGGDGGGRASSCSAPAAPAGEPGASLGRVTEAGLLLGPGSKGGPAACVVVDGLARRMSEVSVKDYSDVLKYHKMLETDPFHTDELDQINAWQPCWADHGC